MDNRGALLTLPRCFAHVHFAATDSPMTALLLLLVPALDRGLAPRWAWIPGVLIGLAASFKITAVILCAPLLALFLACAYTDWKSCLARFWIVVLTAGIVFYLLNPDWWLTPWARLGEFAGATASRRQWAPFSLLYFGQLYSYRGPFHYPLGILLVTTPLIHLGLLVAGMLRLRLRPFRACCRHWAMVVGGAAPIVLLMVPFSPTNDMERYLLPAYPFLAAMMAVGLQPLWERFRPVGKPNGPVLHRVALAVMLSLAAGWTVSRSVRNHPRELCYFNEWVGGAAGGRRLGFEVTYWREPLDDRALASINRICRGQRFSSPLRRPTIIFVTCNSRDGLPSFPSPTSIRRAMRSSTAGRLQSFGNRDSAISSNNPATRWRSPGPRNGRVFRYCASDHSSANSACQRAGVPSTARSDRTKSDPTGCRRVPGCYTPDAPASAITGVNRIHAMRKVDDQNWCPSSSRSTTRRSICRCCASGCWRCRPVGSYAIELVFVNDGSTDGSLAYLTSLIAAHGNIRVVDLCAISARWRRCTPASSMLPATR